MQFDFLEAADGLALTKSFTKDADGNIAVHPYPFVYSVNSYSVDARNPEELFNAVRDHAAKGHCLLKGRLAKTLKGERRAGMTSADEPTQWLLLDLDFQDGWSSVDAFLANIMPEWADVSYIWQHSASAGIRYHAGLRGHLWVMLDRAVSPSVIKDWLKERNLKIRGLTQQLELTASGRALKWPLDITTCQNDKLIYIAPPTLHNLTDPLDERIVLVRKKHDFAPVPTPEHPPATIETLNQEMVETLREKLGLAKSKAKYKDHGSLTVLTNPEACAVTDVKDERGFIYLNLNGGDSWGYYFPRNKPELLYNFKGEPIMRLRDIAPEFYQSFLEKQQQQRYGDLTPYVFREPMRDAYYNVLYSPSRETLDLVATASSKERLQDFMSQFGRALPDPLEDWQVVFNPTLTDVIRPGHKWLNLFRPTTYIRLAPQLTKVTEIPPVIDKVLNSICAGDWEAKAHFLNWLAVVFQTRERTETSWVFHGVSGTGKGLLLNKILRPLFGERHVLEWSMQSFEEQYNAGLEQTCLLWLDEFHVPSSKQGDMVMNKLKQYITEAEIPIRAMRANKINMPNYLNTIIATNHPDPILISDHDRRFNIAPPQERPLLVTTDEVSAIDDELMVFAAFLAHYDADQNLARRVLMNDAREQMIVASQTTTERFFTSARIGDFEWFASFIRADNPMNEALSYQRYETILQTWAADLAKHNLMKHGEQDVHHGEVKISRDDLRAVYGYIIGSPTSAAKFSRMASIHRINMKQMKYQGRNVQGMLAQFTATPEQLEAITSPPEKTDGLRVIQGDKQ